MKFARRIAVASWLALMAGAVHATATASLTVSDLRLSLIDLNPGDDTAPSIYLSGDSSASAGEYTDHLPTSEGTAAYGVGAFAPVAATAPAAPTTGATAVLSGNVFGLGATAHVTAFDSEPIHIPSFSDAGALIWFSPPGSYFVLSPFTAVLISGVAEAEVSSDGGNYTGSVGAFMRLEGSTSHGNQLSQSGFTLNTYQRANGTYVDTGLLSVSFVNLDSTAAYGNFEGNMGAGAAGFVPEAPSAAMFMAGVVLLFAARRLREQWMVRVACPR